MKYIFIVISFFSFFKPGVTQQVTVYGQNSLWNADNICDMDFTGCKWNSLNQGGLLGYAYHPGGSLWLILTEQYGDPNDEFSRIKIFDVQIQNCQYSLLYTINLPRVWSAIGAANIDYKGRLYLNINEYDSISNKSIRTLSRIANPAQPIIERVYLKVPQQKFWEIHFTNNRIYMVDLDKPYIRIFDTNFVLIDTIITQKHIWGLTSFSNGCDSVNTYATHMGITTEEYQAISTPDTMMYISEYDFETNTLTPVCNYWMGNNVANTQLTSPLEFLSSDPECDLLIDLDRDNSTGVYPYDYIDSTIYCSVIQSPVCDQDVYVHASVPLDSIVMTLSGIKEIGSESIISIGLPSGITFIMRNDSTYLLTATFPTDLIYLNALLSLRYEHNGQQRSGGERRVIFQGFNAVKDGVKITARIQISSLPYAGEDVTLFICTDTLIGSLSALTGATSSGSWFPVLKGGGDFYNSAIDASEQYSYVVTDPLCGHDTAIVTIVRDQTGPVDILGDDQILCAGDMVELNAGLGGSAITWDDGSVNVLRVVTEPGDYWVSVATSGGCIYKDSVKIEAGEIWQPSIQRMHPICGLVNGRIGIDSLEYHSNTSLLLDNIYLATHYADNLSEGIYHITSISSDGCATTTWVTLTDVPSMKIQMDTIVFVPEDVWHTINYNEINAISVSDMQFDPGSSIRWNGSSIEVFGDQDRRYRITFIDENGCIEVHDLDVKVEKAKGIYLPNIFYPGSNATNHVWQAFFTAPYVLEHFRLYDRWGNVVYESGDAASWDGTFDGVSCAAGVYVYQLVLLNTNTVERKLIKGDVTLIR